MRIGIDATPLANRNGGGIPRYTRCLLDGLGRVDGHNEYLLYGAGRKTWHSHLPKGFRWSGVQHRSRRFLDPFFRVDGMKLDCFHGTNYFAPWFETAARVLTVHDLTVHLFRECHPTRRKLRHSILPELCRRAKRIIVDSECTKRDLIEYFEIDHWKIDVIRLAAEDIFYRVTCERTLEHLRSIYHLPERFVLSVGVVEPRKNLPQLITAMADLRGKGIPQDLVIAGPFRTSYRSQLLEFARRESKTGAVDIRFLGPVSDEDLPGLYSLCDLFVYLSQYEGFGLPPIEAMACGAPAVVAGGSALAEIYADIARLAPPDNPSELRRILREVLESSALRDEMGQRGHHFANSRTWDNVAKETLTTYERATRV